MLDKTEKKNPYRLERYYNAINISALIITPLFGFIIYSNRATFTWVTHPILIFWAFIGIAIWDALFIFLRAKTREKIYYDISSYGFIVFFFFGIYATGGVNSAFVITLLFPLLVAAIDLDEKSVRTRGMLITIFYALLIFVSPGYWHDSSIIIRHFLQVILYASLAVYVYILVKETLRQRYEKDEAKKSFLHLIELNKLKSSFINATSHQLRTPLTGVKWAIESISESRNISTEERGLLDESKARIEKSIAIVGRILKTAEMDGESFLPKIKESCQLAEMMHEIIDDLSFLTGKNKVRIIFTKSGEGAIVCEKESLKAALVNVVDNAVRYSRLHGEINISVVDMGEKSVVTVKDNGIGISEEDQMFLFERFFRGRNAIKVDPNETGVGLYIAKNIIELHGGSISLASKLNQGTIVTVTLPIQQSV